MLPNNDWLYDEYVNKERSFIDIAKELGTYPNKVRRLAIKWFPDKIRDKSEAQRASLESGRHLHPTKGRERTEEEKLKISAQLSKTWEKMGDKERQEYVDRAKLQRSQMTAEEIEHLNKLAQEGSRKAAKEGSKVEKYLLRFLTKSKLTIEYHRERLIANQRLHIDLYLPQQMIAVEVDGPSHFKPIWGDLNLQRNQHTDDVKSGLLLMSGISLIRIKMLTKCLSRIKMHEMSKKVLQTIESIKDTKKPQLIELEI